MEKGSKIEKTPLARTEVLNGGFVELWDVMGDDSTIADAARTSYSDVDKRTKDESLLRYMWNHAHCYHPDMEVLTTNGWKKWKDCGNEEVLLVPDPVTKTITPELCQILQFDVDEELVKYNNDRMSFCVTKNHRMYFKKRTKTSQNYEWYTAGDMSKWGHFEGVQNYTLVGNSGSSVYQLYKFLGFYLGDGFKPSANRYAFRLKKKRKIDLLYQLLTALNLEYTTRVDSKNVTNFSIKATPILDIHLNNSKANNKQLNYAVSTIIEEQNLDKIKGLYDGLIASDGSSKKDRPQLCFSSTSTYLHNLFQTLSACLGNDCHERKQKEFLALTSFTGSRTSLESRPQYFSLFPYKGKVFCSSTKTSALIVRGASDKFAFICGNSSPFEQVIFQFRCKMPIFVARQWGRHRTARINECSGRYSKLPEEYYDYCEQGLPLQSSDNNQGSQLVTLDSEKEKELLRKIEDQNKDAFSLYQELLEEGVSKEIARCHLPVSTYTQWVWQMDLHNLFHFLNLRMDSHAQPEIQVYAKAIYEMIKPYVPISCKAFEDYTLNSLKLSDMEIKLINQISSKAPVDYSLLSKRELGEFKIKLEKLGLMEAFNEV